MRPSSLVSAVIASFSFAMLSACGGGSGESASGGDFAAPILSNACNPTLEQFKSIAQPLSDFAQISKALGCEKTLSDKYLVYGKKYGYVSGTTYVYRWGSDNSSAEVLLNAFENVDTGAVTFEPPTFKTNLPKNSCVIKQLDLIEIRPNQSVDEMNRLLGCNGTIQSYSLIETGSVRADITWGASPQAFTVTTVNNSSTKSYYLSSSAPACKPDLSSWNKLLIGDTVTTVQAKLGCEGYMDYWFNNQYGNLEPRLSLGWGNLSTTDYSALNIGDSGPVLIYKIKIIFSNGLLAAKYFY